MLSSDVYRVAGDAIQHVEQKESVKMEIAQDQFVVDPKGKKTSVILSLERYERLMEDLHDLAIAAERRDEQLVSFDEMKRRLKKDGIL